LLHGNTVNASAGLENNNVLPHEGDSKGEQNVSRTVAFQRISGRTETSAGSLLATPPNHSHDLRYYYLRSQLLQYKADRCVQVTSSPIKSSKPTMKYPNGALRITRTPGRAQSKNCVNLPDVIHKEHLISACVFSFFIAGDELYDHLPLSHSSDAVPVSTPYCPCGQTDSGIDSDFESVGRRGTFITRAFSFVL
jgi:hypothetical protein